MRQMSLGDRSDTGPAQRRLMGNNGQFPFSVPENGIRYKPLACSAVLWHTGAEIESVSGTNLRSLKDLLELGCIPAPVGSVRSGCFS